MLKSDQSVDHESFKLVLSKYFLVVQSSVLFVRLDKAGFGWEEISAQLARPQWGLWMLNLQTSYISELVSSLRVVDKVSVEHGREVMNAIIRS